MTSNFIVDKSYILIDEINDVDEYKFKDFVDNETQYDDELDDDYNNREKLVNYWSNIEQYEQKSKLWLQQRSNYLGGSEAGAVLNCNHYQSSYHIIWGKLETIPFNGFKATYHGNKYEDTAAMLYEILFNVKIDEFGFLPSRKISFLGASPDGIVSTKKFNGINLTNNIGTLIEIKCPPNRKINMNSKAELFDIIPEYYYAQVQQQMFCCELNKTDFVQIKVIEYKNKECFIKDTNEKCKFKTRDNKFKGAVIQILPIEKFKGKDLTFPSSNDTQNIYKYSKFIHQPRLDMTFEEIKQWIIDVRKQNIPDIEDEDIKKHYIIREGYVYHRVFWYKIDHGRIKRINYSDEWITKHMKQYEYCWNCIEFFRKEENERFKNIFCQTARKINNEEFRKSTDKIDDDQERMDYVIKSLMNNDEEEIKNIINEFDLDI